MHPLHAAFDHHQAGRADAARKLYEQVLRREPRNPEALHLFGMLLIDQGDAAKGLQLLRRAVAYAPDALHILNNLAVALCQLKRFDEAIPVFDKVLARDPTPTARLNRARALADLGRAGETLVALDALLADGVDNPEIRSMRGSVRTVLGDAAGALADLDAALAAEPEQGRFHANKATALMVLGRREEALAHHEAALDAGYGALLGDYALVLLELGHYARAVAMFRAVLAERADDVPARYGLGCALLALRRLEDALDCFEEVLELAPGHDGARHNAGVALLDLGRYAEAVVALDAAPQPVARGQAFHARLQCCDWTGYDQTVQRLSAALLDGERVDDPFMTLAWSAQAAVQLRCAEIHVAACAPPMAPRPALVRGQKLRIAYVSRDFRSHAVSFLMAGVFERHDRSRFEVTAIALQPAEDSPFGRRVEAAFDRFIDVSAMTDEEACAVMRGVDIAVDLMGHTAGSRPGLFARRCAPVQVSYLGYPGTVGAPYADAIIADDIVIPPGSERFYSERVVRLPGCFQANDDARALLPAPTRAEAGLPDEAFVFCCFSAAAKFNPAMFTAAMALLRDVPDSVLWLATGAAARENLRREAAARGIDPARLIFAPRLDYDAHLARFRLADLALDTYPFNGGATVSDALRAGVPVVTRMGEPFAARMAASLLHAAGLPGLVAEDEPGFSRIALGLAQDKAALAAARQTLHAGNPLFDTARFLLAYERALEDLAVEHTG